LSVNRDEPWEGIVACDEHERDRRGRGVRDRGWVLVEMLGLVAREDDCLSRRVTDIPLKALPRGRLGRTQDGLSLEQAMKLGLAKTWGLG
jgi:hypothetical protein